MILSNLGRVCGMLGKREVQCGGDDQHEEQGRMDGQQAQ